MNRGKSKRTSNPEAPPEAVESPAESVEEEEGERAFSTAPRNEQRLQKIIAAAGVTSRRKAEELILTGRVQVNGATITELGAKADAGQDHIRVDGKLLKPVSRFFYFILNKPKGYITSASDPEGRPTVMEFFERAPVRVYPVGRLDYQSEGLLVMTNDGDLANLLTKASSKVEKTYLVKIAGVPTEASLDQLRAGIMIEKGKVGSHEGRVLTQPARIRMARDAENPWYEVILTEGRNREIRKMFEEIGHFVEKIRRVGYGPLVLDVAPGEMRELEPAEVTALQRAARGIISRVRPPAIKLPSAKRRPASAPRPQAPAPPPPPPVKDIIVPFIPEVHERPSSDSRPPRPQQRIQRSGEGRTPRPERSGEGRPPRQQRRGEGRAFPASPRSPGSDRSAAARPRSDTPRRSTGGRPSGPGRSREEQPAIDPRTGSPYRVLFGDRPNASGPGGPRKPATFDLSKRPGGARPGAAGGKPPADKRPSTGGRPAMGSRFTGGKTAGGRTAGAPNKFSTGSKAGFSRKPAAGKRDRPSRRP